MSHPTWVRGLKQNGDVVQNNDWMSHPTWVRGLKHEEISGSPKHYQNFKVFVLNYLVYVTTLFLSVLALAT